MEIPNNFHYKISKPDISNLLKYATLRIASEFNCLRIATVEEVHPEDMTVTVKLLNKRTNGLNKDGTPFVQDYAQIRAKICYCNPYFTCPINVGDDCLLFFADREIESWFINGDAQPLNYQRMHDLTDAFAVFGIRSLPKMITLLTDCLHLFYGESDVQIKDEEIDITTALLNIIGNETVSGTLTGGTVIAGNGATGEFKDGDGKTITVANGIITNLGS